MANGKSKNGSADAGRTVTSMMVTVPIASINVDWDKNLSRQFINDKHRRDWLKDFKATAKWKAFVKSIGKELISPPLVAPYNKDGKVYDLIAGFLRMEAAKELGWTEVPVKVTGTTDRAELDRLNFIENAERHDLSTFQRASAALKYYRDHKLTSDKAALSLGMAPGTVRALVSLRENLCEPILRAWADRDADVDPLVFKATTIYNLGQYAKAKAEKAQLNHFALQMKIAEGKTKEEAQKLVDDGFNWTLPKAKGRGGKGGKGGKGGSGGPSSVKLDVVQDILTKLSNMEHGDEESNFAAMVDGGIAVCRYLMGEVKTVRIGKIVLLDPDADVPEADDTVPEEDANAVPGNVRIRKGGKGASA